VGSYATQSCPDPAIALLGLPGFEVLDVAEQVSELVITVQTSDLPVSCSECGVVATGNGRRECRVRDVPRGSTPVILVWAKRLWRCREAACPVGGWTEAREAIGPRASLTTRAEVWAMEQVGRDHRSVASVARELAVSWHTVMAAVRLHGEPLVDDRERFAEVTSIGVDEHAWQHANGKRRTGYVTGVVDITCRPARLLDVVLGRSGPVLGAWISEQEPQWRDRIEVAALDPFRGYANALKAHLPGATLVLDAFHVVKLANTALTEVRCRVQQTQLGHRGRKHDPLYGIRRILVRNPENLTIRALEKLHAAFAAGDPDGEVQAAWEAVHKLALAYRAETPAERLTAADQALAHLHKSDVKEIARLGRTLRAWRHEFLAYHDTDRASNGPTEATNLIIEKNRRVAHGYRNFDNYRLRLLLQSGINWAPRPALPIRTRKTTFAA
jgi:transposase